MIKILFIFENSNSAIEYMKKEGSIEKNLRILLKYGQKLLKNNEEISQRFIKEIISSIISINNNSGTNSMTNYKYEKLMEE